MIGRLHGRLVEKQPPHLLLDVNGVGYEVEAPMSTFYVLPEVGAEVLLHTHLAVREDAHVLFGFASAGERGLFRSLLRVSGVGGRVALGILSGISPEGFAECVRNQDTVALVKLPGVGKRTAERLIVEMRDRLGDWGTGAPGPGKPADRAAPGSPVEDAVSALMALGYKPPEASRMVRAVEGGAELPSEEIIRLALQGALK